MPMLQLLTNNFFFCCVSKFHELRKGDCFLQDIIVVDSSGIVTVISSIAIVNCHQCNTAEHVYFMTLLVLFLKTSTLIEA